MNRCHTVLILALALVMPSATAAQAQESAAAPPPPLVFDTAAVNPTWGALEDVNLETPQAAVEHFVTASRDDDWRRAAAALDFRLLGAVDAARAAEVARRFFYVLNQELWIDWDDLPDRPDGLLEGSSMKAEEPMAGQARRSIRLGDIDVGGRLVPVQVDRVKAPSGEPMWLFSAHTVDNIDDLWDVHGPSWLAEQMPPWARQRGPLRIPVWQWIGLVVALVLAPLATFLAALTTCRFLARRSGGQAACLMATIEWPTSALIGALTVWVTLKWLLNLPSAVAKVLEPLSLIVWVAMAVWLAMRTTTYFVDRVIKGAIRDHHDEESASRARLLTQITVARHVVLLALALIGIAFVLLQLDTFRAIGITMLTSAGAAAVILGIAGHTVLGNLIAGLQIALAQPFRIGDSVYVENNWGRIEDISYVDVVVRTWDQRRLVFPIGYFVSNWFENWSKTEPRLVKPIYLKVDYRADVEKIRSKFQEIVQADEDWDSDSGEPEVLVTDCDDETVTVRLACAGADTSRAWSLVCRTREAMIAWLQQVEGGRYLPRRRLELDTVRDRSQASERAAAEVEREPVSA